jgi:hypothetical protein
MPVRSFFVIPLLCISLASSSAQQPSKDPAYAVYNAVFRIMQFPKPDPLILIIASTQSLQCGDTGTGMVLMNGCGIWAPPQTAEVVHEVTQKNWPQMSESTWKSFLSANQKQSTLRDQMTTTWRHQFNNFSDTSPSPAKPDAVILLSSVGFNTDKSQALVYVLLLSYMQRVRTSGTLFLVKKLQSGSWAIDGKETLIETTSDR